METHIISLVQIKIGLHVSLVITPNCASHARPRFLDRQNTLDVISINLFARDGIDDGEFDTEKRQRGASRFSGRDSSQGCNYVRASFGLPVCLSSNQPRAQSS